MTVRKRGSRHQGSKTYYHDQEHRFSTRIKTIRAQGNPEINNRDQGIYLEGREWNPQSCVLPRQIGPLDKRSQSKLGGGLSDQDLREVRQQRVYMELDMVVKRKEEDDCTQHCQRDDTKVQAGEHNTRFTKENLFATASDFGRQYTAVGGDRVKESRGGNMFAETPGKYKLGVCDLDEKNKNILTGERENTMIHSMRERHTTAGPQAQGKP